MLLVNRGVRAGTASASFARECLVGEDRRRWKGLGAEKIVVEVVEVVEVVDDGAGNWGHLSHRC